VEQKPISEEVLIRKAVKGSLEAFNQLVLLYQDLAYNYACSLIADPAAAEDNTQESFIKAFQNIGNFRGGSFRSWLLRIVTNTTYDSLRRAKHLPTQPLFPEDEYGEAYDSTAWLVDPSASLEETVEQNEAVEHLYQLMDELAEKYRQVLTLVDIHELDYGEAARILDVPIGTVKSRLARARLQMREKLRAEASYFPDFSPAIALMPS
jgi:RNA polymerase sigma-70 factor (ECF subfamily)